MLGELVRVSNARRAQTESTRAQLLAMLGHDLRDPLHSINMAGMVLEKTAGGDTKRHAGPAHPVVQQPHAAHDRPGAGHEPHRARPELGLAPEPVDLARWSRTWSRKCAWPTRPSSTNCRRTTPSPSWATVRRMGQVMSNLLSNARHHGDPNQAIVVRVCRATRARRCWRWPTAARRSRRRPNSPVQSLQAQLAEQCAQPHRHGPGPVHRPADRARTPRRNRLPPRSGRRRRPGRVQRPATASLILPLSSSAC
jgi:signal transduction histidine kinase